MKDFVNNVLNELKSDSGLNQNSLVKLVIESTDKSIVNQENYDHIYVQLKDSLNGVNEHLKNRKIDMLLSQFNKKERTTDSILNEMSKVANLQSKLNLIKESNAYSNPIIKSKVDNYETSLRSGSPEFKLYPSFINEFTQHIHESSVKSAVDQVINIVENKSTDFEVLNTIHIMNEANSRTPIYESIADALKKSLAENKYSADIINLMHGESNLPLVTQLVNNLRVMEASKDGSFTLGAGNSDTNIKNTIAPSMRIKKGVLTYIDNRFIKISESTKLTGNETEVHINEGFTIATMDPEFIKAKFPRLYNVSEAFASLGFTQLTSKEGVESNSIRNFKLGLQVNESKGLDIYVNDNKIDGLNSINLTEALTMETPDVRNRVQCVFENLSSIFAFEFIKNITNDRMLSEATVFELGGNYIVCNKPNSADRVWNQVDESEMSDFFNENFQYDISNIFATKIDEAIETKRKIEAAKAAILENINKLEGSVSKLDETIKTGDVDSSRVAELEKLKTSINESISKLKEDYINVDLAKSEVNEQGDWWSVILDPLGLAKEAAKAVVEYAPEIAKAHKKGFDAIWNTHKKAIKAACDNDMSLIPQIKKGMKKLIASKVDEGEMPAGLKAYHEKKKAKKDGAKSGANPKDDSDGEKGKKKDEKKEEKETGKIDESKLNALMAKYGKVHS
jgi:hypothetical protein